MPWRVRAALSLFIRRRLFLKYILFTLLIGVTLNAVVLAVYSEYRRDKQTGQIAAEIATVANRIARPASALVREGKTPRVRELLAVFAAFPYAICADLYMNADERPTSSWPVIGCARIKKPGRELDVALPGAGPGVTMRVRIDPNVLAAELMAELLVLGALGTIGGLALVLAGVVAFLLFINHPLSLLLTSIELFERHDDPQPVAYQSMDEIGQVVSSFNMMLKREVERVSEIRTAHSLILDSVTYASRIQGGLLPTKQQLTDAFAESSLIWQPRDTVGGDIYWLHSRGSRTTVALLDCTGHGVPGGFMTMLAIATLERIFTEDENMSPADLLSRLSDLTRGLLNQDVANPLSNDGMDAAVCQIDRNSAEGIFAAARLSLILCGDGQVKRLRGDRISLGYADTPARPRFKETTFPVKLGTKLFLTTDGIIDQPGGERKIAFGYRRFMDVIDAHQAQSLEAILGALEREFAAYAGHETRRDDVAVLAFRPNRRDSRCGGAFRADG
jgi:serine phosphatase RsbU (regulator of sigma subunit)